MAEGGDSTLLAQTDTDASDTVDNSNSDDTNVEADQVVDENADPIEGAAEGEKATDKVVEKPTEKKAPVVPETYEKFTMPEGMSLNQEAIDSFSPLAKELGLTQENAQKVADMGAKLVNDALSQQDEALETIKNEWAEQIQADKDIGGDKFKDTIEVAIKARNTFGSEGLNKILDQSGLGNHPEVIRFFHNVGKAISEDVLVTDKSSTQKELSEAEMLYPGMGLKDG